MHEEDFWSSWPREDEKSEEERKMKLREKEKKRVKRGKERRSKKRTKRGRSKEDVRVLFLWKLLKLFVKGETCRVAEMFPGNTSWRRLRACLTVSLLLVSWWVRCLVGVM